MITSAPGFSITRRITRFTDLRSSLGLETRRPVVHFIRPRSSIGRIYWRRTLRLWSFCWQLEMLGWGVGRGIVRLEVVLPRFWDWVTTMIARMCTP